LVFSKQIELTKPNPKGELRSQRNMFLREGGREGEK
jgi:hypothetical protein